MKLITYKFCQITQFTRLGRMNLRPPRMVWVGRPAPRGHTPPKIEKIKMLSSKLTLAEQLSSDRPGELLRQNRYSDADRHGRECACRKLTKFSAKETMPVPVELDPE